MSNQATDYYSYYVLLLTAFYQHSRGHTDLILLCLYTPMPAVMQINKFKKAKKHFPKSIFDLNCVLNLDVKAKSFEYKFFLIPVLF